MIFAAPLWLWLLFPWTGLVVYLLQRARVGTGVPFLRFWPEEAVVPRRRRGIGVPPVWVMLLLGAILMAVIAAARPGPGGDDPARSAVVVVDRGRSLADGDRYARSLASTAVELGRLRIGGRVRIVAAPGPDREVPVDQFQTVASELPATGLDAAADVQSAVDRAVRETAGPVLVLTGSAVRSDSKRVIGVGTGPPGGIAVTSLSVRLTPKPVAMVRILNRSAAVSAMLDIETAKQVISRPVRLGPTGAETTEFVDLPPPGPIVGARVVQPDAIIDNRRWVALQSTTAGLDASASVEPAVQRIARVYEKQHSPDAGAGHVLVGPDVPADDHRPAVVIAPPGSVGAVGAIRIDDPVVSRDVTGWPAAGSAVGMPPGFRAVIAENGVPVVAIGTGPARRVWVNLDLAGWAGSRQFVIFFGNVFDYVTGGESVYGSTGPTRLGSGWRRSVGDPPAGAPAGMQPGMWPGVYEFPDGRRVAVNADAASAAVITVPAGAGVATEPSGSTGWGPYLLIAALILIVAGLAAPVFSGRIR